MGAKRQNAIGASVMLAFVIPGEPVAKARPRFLREAGRKPFPDKKTENYEGIIKQYAALAMRSTPPFEGPLRMTIRATFLIPQAWSEKRKREAVWKTSKPDWDNIGKIVSDACNMIVYQDDAQVVEAIVQKRYGPIAGLTVTVEQLSQIEGVG